MILVCASLVAEYKGIGGFLLNSVLDAFHGYCLAF